MKNLQWFERIYSTMFVETIPTYSGVYIIWENRYNVFELNAIVVYVGQAQDLKKRLSEHLSESETNIELKNRIRLGGLSVSYAYIQDGKDRDNAETTLIEMYQPKHNKTKGNGYYIEMCLPCGYISRWY